MAFTKKQFTTLSELYDYYNKFLFKAELPDCIVCLARHRGAAGVFMPSRWKRKEGENLIHEIIINPENIAISDMEWHQTLVHEMVHLWQEVFGKPSRACYHNKEWSTKMESIGLMPSTTGKPGGEKTGQSMSDYAIEGGLFKNAFLNIGPKSLENLILPFVPNHNHQVGILNNEYAEATQNGNGEGNGEEEKKMGVKKKYTCSCGNNVWGRPGLVINCGICEQPFIEHAKNKINPKNYNSFLGGIKIQCIHSYPLNIFISR